jgi:hypothetical protein
MSTLKNQVNVEVDSAPATTAPPAEAREQFIPLRRVDLAQALSRDAGLGAVEAAALARFCRLLHAVVRGHFQATLEQLKETYAPFDPDADTRRVGSLSEGQRGELRARLFEGLGFLLARGNFVRLAEAEINRALDDRSHWGLHLKVDFTAFERLELYARGDTIGTRYRRHWRTRFRREAVEVPIYQRLVILFRLRPGRRFSRYVDSRDVYLKLFKDIPKPDLDMLLPETRVTMSLLDRVKVMLPTATGIAVAISKGIGMGLTLPFLLLVGGTLGYGVRSMYGYLNTRQKYQLSLTQSLYYQNIDNNAGVIHRLLDEAEEQENRETLLAWFFLWRHAGAEGWTPAELDLRIEEFLHREADQAIDFEIADALEKLARFGIAENRAGRWHALPVEPAVAALAKYWQALPEEL